MEFGIFDYHDDLNNEYLSPFLKLADLPPKDKTKLKDSDFALIIRDTKGNVRRYYPINDEMNTKLSLDYFTKTGHQLDPYARRVAAYYLKKAAHTYELAVPAYINTVLEGVTVPISSNVVDLSHLPEEEAAETEYLLPEAKLLPVRSDEQLKQYVHYFDKIAANLEENQQEEAAFHIIRLLAGRKIDIQIPSTIAKLAQNYAMKRVRELEKEREKSTAEEIRKIAANIEEEWKGMKPSQRLKVAMAIRKAASEHNFAYPVIVDAYLNYDFNSISKMNLDKRAQLLRHFYGATPKYFDEKSKLKEIQTSAYLTSTLPSEETKQKSLLKIAYALEKWDTSLGFDKYWYKEIDDPFITFSKYASTVSIFGKYSSMKTQPKSVALRKIAELKNPLVRDEFIDYLESRRDDIMQFFNPRIAPILAERPAILVKIATVRTHPLKQAVLDFFRYLGFDV